jgi:hypothetical protein
MLAHDLALSMRMESMYNGFDDDHGTIHYQTEINRAQAH